LLREQEREEIERRRALPEEQRLKEDTDKADKSRAEKSKGQQKFLQKYWHKGAFHQVWFDLFSRIEKLELTCIGRRSSQTTRLHRSHRIDGRCVTPAKGHASQKLWKERSNQIYPPSGPGHYCW
jgi:hypothetical protein